MHVPLERQRPVFGRPLLDVLHAERDLPRREVGALWENQIRFDVNPERIVLILLLRISAVPDDRVILEVLRGHGRDRAETLDAGDVVDELISRLHLLRFLPVPALDPLYREAVLTSD